MRSRKSSQTSSHKAQQAIAGLVQSTVARIIGSGLIVIGIFSFLNSFFTVSTVECRIDQRSCPDELLGYMEHFKGLPIFGRDYSQVLQEHFYPLPILLTDTEKYLPNTVILHFTTQPLAYQLSIGDRKLTVSTGGLVFENPELTAPIAITVHSPFEQMTVSETQMQPAVHTCLISLVEQLQAANLPPAKVSWVDKDIITLIMDGEQQTIFLDCENPSSQVAKLSLLVSSPEYQDTRTSIREVDMRFDLPVLRMQQ